MINKPGNSKAMVLQPSTANQIADVINDYQQRMRMGTAKSSAASPVSQTSVKVKNLTGGDLVRGSVVDLGTYLLTIDTDTRADHEHLWFQGNTQATNGHYGVVRLALKSDEIGECQISGVCLARVNFTDITHRYANPKAGETYFQSAASGVVEIACKHETGTGVQEAMVVLRAPSVPSVPFIGIATQDCDGYRKGGGSVAKFSSALYQPVGLEINGSGVLDESSDLDTGFGTVEAYNVARYKQFSGDCAYVFRDWKNQWCAFPLNEKFQPQCTLTTSFTGDTTGNVLHTNWAAPGALGELNWGDLFEAAVISTKNDIKFRYSIRQWDYLFNYTLTVTPGSAATVSPNTFYGSLGGSGSAGAWMTSFKTAPFIQHGTSDNGRLQDYYTTQGSRSGQLEVDMAEGANLGYISVDITGLSSLTVNFSCSLRLRPAMRALALGIGY